MKSLILSLAIVAVVGGAFFALRTPSVSADDTKVEQDQEQKLKVKCKVGAYGETSYCEAEGKQEQSQKVVIRDRVLGVTKEHVPVNTALDLKTALSAAGVLTTGAGAFAIKRKINK